MKYRLEELVDLKIGRTPPRKEQQWFNQGSDDWKWVSIKDMGVSGRYISETSETISKEAQTKFNIPIVRKGTVILSFKLTVGRVAIVDEDMLTNEAIAQLPINDTNIVRPLYLYYLLKNYKFDQLGSTSSIATAVNSSYLKKMEIEIPDIHEQDRVISILQSLDNELELNREINDNLLQQLDALYHEIFDNCQMKLSCPAGNYFDISIGKTPPRKEQWWFTSNTSDIRWVSISDMGNCGTYISNSSEYLTQDAVDKFNVVVVPDNTVILSFKLTIGRLAITDGDLTTNEAIAHFKTDNKAINPYLYFYLRNYKYETLGSTSSIATAVNSKIIKNMPFLLPHDAELCKFNELALPLMGKIKLLEHENKHLEQLRDSLLPKLISGEIDVDSIGI